ncbi:CHAT domain-containing protein [Trichocoleus sp. ST-U3]|uniref:CHAT domain-containing tetratricopeptide repeat protein n=1 Tax=Coleofasciculus sp. FACHB-542 TaxID=2692787 RepID=UPI001682BC4A|nr:CHAT domain-containing tetratricopeptide repeat protein [Coleofasciculus sp. FACHB-542]MBD2088253.1 CHAT domain-containing protein [Coleofasciculus sp. FACHB-542]
MRLKRFFWVAPTTVLLIVSQSFRLNFPVPFAGSPVVAQTSDARKAEADRLLQQGLQQDQTSQSQVAIQSWQQALIIYREIKDRQGEVWALGSLGNAYLGLEENAKAIEYFQKALVIAREIQDHISVSTALGNIGIAYYALKNYANAIEYSQQALVIAREIQDREVEYKALSILGEAYYSLKNYVNAIEYSQQALVIIRAIQNRKIEYKMLSNLGKTYFFLGEYTKAIDYHQQALAIAKEIEDRQVKSATLANLSEAYRNLEEYSKAIEYAQEALAIAREIKHRESEGLVLVSLSWTFFSLGDYVSAIEYSQQALAISREIQDPEIEGNALSSLSLTFSSLGDYARTIEYSQQALSIARKIKDREGEGKVLGNLSSVYSSLGNYTKAIDYLQQWLLIAREIKDRESEGRALGGIGNIYSSLGNYTKAIDYHQQDLAISKEIKDSLSEGQALNNLGLALYKSGNLLAAEKRLREAMEVKESLRNPDLDDRKKVSFFDTQVNTYHTLQQVLVAQNKTNTALEISERGRARAFVELLTKRLSPKSDALPPIKHPSFEDIKKISQQQNAAIVEYSAFNKELYIWVISPNGKVTFRPVDLKSLGAGATAGGSPLRKLVTESLESLGVGEDRNGIFEVSITNPAADPQRQTKSLKQLHQLLIQPIADLLPSNPEERVIFIPHQDLFRVPFAALIDSEGKYLIEKHTILTAPSIQLLELTHKQRQNASRSGQEALVVGNPSPMPKGFTLLKGAQKEALDVAQLLKTQPLIGSQATEPAIMQKLPSARIIHLATHGTFNEQQPLLGGVALAQTGKDTQNDGLLTADEIFNLDGKLSAELLVLSACNTGRGRITGDGVIGLSRSFIAAGIPSVLVSLWAVPDAPTAELMTEFYTNLYQKKLDKAQSLRMAMLKMMKTHRDNPRAWAAFTLIGEAE